MSNQTAVALLKNSVAVHQFRAISELAIDGIGIAVDFWMTPELWCLHRSDEAAQLARQRRPSDGPLVVAQRAQKAARSVVEGWTKFVERTKAACTARHGKEPNYLVVRARHSRNELLGLAQEIILSAEGVVDGILELAVALKRSGGSVLPPTALDARAAALFELIVHRWREPVDTMPSASEFEQLTSAAASFFEGVERFVGHLCEDLRSRPSPTMGESTTRRGNVD